MELDQRLKIALSKWLIIHAMVIHRVNNVLFNEVVTQEDNDLPLMNELFH